jgi:hypothetical protein
LCSGEIGGSCQNLGITLGGQSPSPPPAGGSSANSTSSSPNAGTPSSSPKTSGIPFASPGISPVSGLGAPSPSFSPGRVPVVLRTPLSDFHLTARVLCPSIILHIWQVLVGCPTKTKLWLSLETTFTSRVACNWTPFEDRVSNTMCGGLWLATKV